MFEIVPLGTSSATPTRDRHLSAVALIRKGDVFLFDCGEGTQFRLLAARIKAFRIRTICISHFHGDHFFGLIGLISTLSLLKRTSPLHLVGPAGLRQCVEYLCEIASIHLSFCLQYTELNADEGRAIVQDEPEYFIEARPLKHRIATFGFRFQEEERPGRMDAQKAAELGVVEDQQLKALREGKSVIGARGRSVAPTDVIGPRRPGASFAYCSDTRPTASSVLLAENVDLLYHEATFGHDMLQRAIDTGHSTALEAAQIASRASARQLLLGHLSARYKNDGSRALEREARGIFSSASVAEELKRYAVRPFADVMATGLDQD